MEKRVEEKDRPKDVNGLPLYVGEEVYYTRKSDYHARGEMVIAKITKITGTHSVNLGSYRSTDTTEQVAKVDKEYIGN